MKMVVAVGVGVATLTASVAAALPASASAAPVIAQHGGVVVHGLHLLNYPARGTLSGTVGGAAAGTRVTLQQVTFPFRAAFRSVATTTTHSGGGYAFSVRPTVATRYRAVSHAKASSVVTYYVSSSSRDISLPNCAGQSRCQATWVFDEMLPPNVARSEAAKHVYFYDAIRSGSLPPTRMFLDPAARVTVKSLTASRYRVTSAWTMQFPAGSYMWHANLCTRDTYAKDGFGLPGSNGCGAPSVSTAAKYLG